MSALSRNVLGNEKTFAARDRQKETMNNLSEVVM